MSIAQFLVSNGYGKNIHEIKKKFYKVNEIAKVGFVFMVNGKKITDINYQIYTGDELWFLLDGKHKYVVS